jgi:hypothetical protein
MENIEIDVKRALGNGRWDKALKRNLVELSVADNYDEAKHEWVATGNVWYRSLGREDIPDWCAGHADKCLCGHNVVYHFEIHNTETGHRDCVGSDHINSYLILREIQERTGLSQEDITDDMIDEWIQVRVKTMIKNAWWDNNGDHFTKLFDDIKDYDLRVNVRKVGSYFDSKYQMMMPKTRIRKAASGAVSDAGYKMASIVWRWNHPDNPKNQRDSRGYPTDKLYQDLVIFAFRLKGVKERIAIEEKRLADRLIEIKNKQISEEAKRQERLNRRKLIVDGLEEKQNDPIFVEVCEYYGVRPFFIEEATSKWEEGFLKDMKKKMVQKKPLSDKQFAKLVSVLEGNNSWTDVQATEKQISYLIKLGYEGETAALNKGEASELIGSLKRGRLE